MYINSLNNYLREKFGCKVFKLAIDGGMTCPNRDGTVGTGGCIFCSGSGSGDFAEPVCGSVTEQLERAKFRIANKAKECKYIAYFQNFSNTYAPTDKLKLLYSEAINAPDVVALSVATRPDCLPDDVISLLAELNRLKPVWVELGLQTVHEKTAGYIRRGYRTEVFDEATVKLRSAGITSIAHMIIGLPGETPEMIFSTAKHIGKTGADGIKFHLLHVLRGTDLESDYTNGKFTLPTLEEYTSLLIGCIRRIPDTVVIHRMTGDGFKRDLIAPLWSANKKNVLNYINTELVRLDVNQGELLK